MVSIVSKNFAIVFENLKRRREKERKKRQLRISLRKFQK